MGNDISIVCRGAVAALAVLMAGCASSRIDPVPDQVSMQSAPPAAAAPVDSPAGSDADGATDAAGASATGETVELKQDAPLRYVVQKGDTLWGISNKFLKDSWQWPEVWYVNPKVKNPHLIYPGDELYLYYVNGRPQVAKAGAGAPQDTGPAGGTSAFTPRVREASIGESIYSIPLEKIRAFLQSPRVVATDAFDKAPYLVDFEEDHLMGAADNTAYALRLNDTSHSLWQIVRKGETFRDPDDNDVIGYEALPVADSEVRVYGNPATVYLRRSYMEARAGDFLVPMEQDPLSSRFVPHSPGKTVDGKIISVYNGMSQIGQYQVVAINRGTSQGMEPGHVLSVYQSGRQSKDPYAFFFNSVTLPDINAGQIMVFKCAERVSYALVMSSTREMHILDKVEQPKTAQ